METPDKQYDPTFLHARKEAWLILLAWAVSLIWTVGYSTFAGFEATELTLVWGMPSWVFWGVVFPWGAATVFSVWFGLYYMADDELED